MDELQLKKEWELNFDSETLQKDMQKILNNQAGNKNENFIAVYSAMPSKIQIEDKRT